MNVPGAGDQELQEAPRKRLRWWFHLLVIGAYPLVVGALGWQRSRFRGPALRHEASGLLAVCGFELLVFGVVFGLAWLASRASRQSLLLPWAGGFWVIPLSLGYSVGLRLVVALAAAMVAMVLLVTHLVSMPALERFVMANRPDVQALVDVSALRKDPLYFWLTVTLVSFVVAGFREELWRSGLLAGMRALWPGRFGSRQGQLAAVALGAVIFGLGHLAQGPIAVFPTALLGLGLGAIMVWHRSIWPAVLAHGLFDATTFVVLALLPGLASQMPQLR
ncbi:MAG TPA: type II CAAX endopeptidase family protein [Dongiaceae bacterium]|nr:type II CAAX endopeptidase family protein [Dongiaceae bacterium]